MPLPPNVRTRKHGRWIALEMIRNEAGKHFDPEVVAAFEQALPRLLEIYDKHKHIA